jgi:hypothetical protein
VPDQDVDVIAASLVEHLEGAYATMGSPNRLTINVEHTADWWLGELDGPWFKALEAAVRDEWGVEPLHIREGGVSGYALSRIDADERCSVHPVRAFSGEGVQMSCTSPTYGPELGS